MAKPPPRCKKNSDCDANKFCQSKTGNCLDKFAVNAEGCMAHDQCAGSGIACGSVDGKQAKRCLQACKIKETGVCTEGLQCVVNKRVVKGLAGGFQGICQAPPPPPPAGEPSAPTETTSVATSRSGTSPSGIVAMSVAGAVLLGLIGAFLWARSMIRRRRRNSDPKLFTFTPPVPQTERRDSRIDTRLLQMNGARYTHWAMMPEQ